VVYTSVKRVRSHGRLCCKRLILLLCSTVTAVLQAVL